MALSRTGIAVSLCIALALASGLVRAGEACEALALPAIAQFESGGTSQMFSVYSAQTAPIAGPEPDYFDFMFFGSANTTTGVFDLGTAPDNSYATCLRCLSMCTDVDQTTFTCNKSFFQSAGTLYVNAPPIDGVLDVEVTGLRLLEVEYDPDSKDYLPVPGGICYDATFAAPTQASVFRDGFEPAAAGTRDAPAR
ncbi:MAG: hypothetical protein WCZ65_03355 [Lysobacteraceae bacterium]